MLKRFIIYGTIGWSMEIFWTGLHSLLLGNINLRGFTYLWMFPIYGLAIFMEPIHEEIKHLPWYVRGLIWTLIIFAIEYAMGGLLRLLLGQCPWDYTTSTPYHVNGLIRLDYAPAWFIVGLFFERLHETLKKIRL